ncbi:MAG: GDSL-type esterase/lipase family protein [Planctomycetota bacterium]
MLTTLLLALTPLPIAQEPIQAPTEHRFLPGPAGYSIPIFDLDGDASRQVVVDREAGQYLGHVTTALMGDGKTMLAVYPKGHGNGAIVMKRSGDGGLTWSERLAVPKTWETSKEVPTLFRARGAYEAKERLLMFSGLNPIRLATSEDDGVTWSELAPIGDYGGIVACSTVMRLHDGTYLALFHDDGRFIGETHHPKNLVDEAGNPDPSAAHRFHVYAIHSKDGGLTWGPPRSIASHPLAHLCEPLLLRSPDGKQLLCLMRENSRRFNGFFMTSDDEGRTWSTPKQMSAALTGDRHTGTYAPDGRLFLSFRDTARRSPTQGDWVGWVGTYDDIVSGRDGQYRVRLKDNKHRWDCAYPGVELLPDGTFVCTTYGHWEEGEQPYILSTRLKLEELDELAKLNVDTWRIDNPKNPAVVPASREGWWADRQAELNHRAATAAAGEGIDLVFLGDSITQGWESHGKTVWEEQYRSRKALNIGISGDRTQHVLWRLENGNLEGLAPKLCVLMIGTNNSNSDTGDDIADGIFAILRKLRAEQPQMRILLLHIFPRGAGPEDALRRINDRANELIGVVAGDPMIEILDLAPAFLTTDGVLPKEVMPDLLHPEEVGYRIWAEAIEAKVAEMLQEG